MIVMEVWVGGDSHLFDETSATGSKSRDEGSVLCRCAGMGARRWPPKPVIVEGWLARRVVSRAGQSDD
jgi:hypothetical protein